MLFHGLNKKKLVFFRRCAYCSSTVNGSCTKAGVIITECQEWQCARHEWSARFQFNSFHHVYMDLVLGLLEALINFVFLYIILDRDECLDGTHDCDTNAACSNTEGSFSCSCNDGYMGNGTMCTSKAFIFSNLISTSLYWSNFWKEGYIIGLGEKQIIGWCRAWTRFKISPKNLA